MLDLEVLELLCLDRSLDVPILDLPLKLLHLMLLFHQFPIHSLNLFLPVLPYFIEISYFSRQLL